MLLVLFCYLLLSICVQFIVFELKELVAVSKSSSTISDTSLQVVVAVIKRAKKFGIDLLPILQELTSKGHS